VGVLVRATLADPHGASAAIAARLREAGRTVTVLDGCLPGPAGAASPLVVQLLGEVMRNGGTIVCGGEVAHLLADAESRLEGCGVVLDVSDAGEAADSAGGRSAAGHEFSRLLIPQKAAPELVGEIVHRHLRKLGYVAVDCFSSEPALPPGQV